MVTNKITGELASDFYYQKSKGNVKYYLANFKVDNILTLPIQIPESLLNSYSGKLELEGKLCSCRDTSNNLFTFFKCFNIRECGNLKANKRVDVSGVVMSIFPMRTTLSGVDTVTIVSKEYYEETGVSIIHYKARGNLAHKVSRSLKYGDKIKGSGYIAKCKNSYEVILTSIAIGGENNERQISKHSR